MIVQVKNELSNRHGKATGIRPEQVVHVLSSSRISFAHKISQSSPQCMVISPRVSRAAHEKIR